MAVPNHLVIVCGHAIWAGGPKKGFDESEWLIESYKAGETPTFIEHIKAGLEVLSKDERSVVMFSGGPTRKETTISEAHSYANLAAANSYFGFLPDAPVSPQATAADDTSPIPLHPRVLVEYSALDSYHNVLFSIIAFWRAYAAWPHRLTIVSHAFKRARIVDCHCGAIGFPLDRVKFVGINPPNLPADLAAADGVALSDVARNEAGVSAEKSEAMKGAREVVGHWLEDPHGVGEVLARKRWERNLWDIDQVFFDSQEERERSGVKTRLLDEDTEVLDGSVQPWSR